MLHSNLINAKPLQEEKDILMISKIYRKIFRVPMRQNLSFLGGLRPAKSAAFEEKPSYWHGRVLRSETCSILGSLQFLNRQLMSEWLKKGNCSKILQWSTKTLALNPIKMLWHDFKQAGCAWKPSDVAKHLQGRVGKYSNKHAKVIIQVMSCGAKVSYL